MDFMEALDLRAEDIKEPPKLPVGTYRAIVTKIPEITNSNDDLWQFVSFPFRVLEAVEASESELADFGPLTGVNRTHRFIFDKSDERKFKETLFYLKRFLNDHLQVGVDDDGSKGWIKRALDAAPNHQFLVNIGRYPDKRNPEVPQESIKATAPV